MDRRKSFRFGLATLPVFGALACGPSEVEQGAPPAEAPLQAPVAAVPAGEAPLAEASAEAGAAVVSGIYEVRGVTVQAANGRQREISGTLELSVEGERYETTFDLGTTAPDLEGVPVKVTGSGRGFIVGGTLTGTTEEEMAIDPARGAEPTAELATEGLKIVSSSQAHFDDEGALHIHLQNEASEGASYSPSVTVLVGRRVGALTGGAGPPPSPRVYR
jgi:hypothetical protein